MLIFNHLYPPDCIPWFAEYSAGCCVKCAKMCQASIAEATMAMLEVSAQQEAGV